MSVEVVAALLWDDERRKFLICQRPANKSNALLWEFAGGKVEPGETKSEALVREIREELGIVVSVGDVYTELSHEYPDITVHLTLFQAEIKEGVPVRKEHHDLRWIEPEEIQEFMFCPADQVILTKFLSDKTTQTEEE